MIYWLLLNEKIGNFFFQTDSSCQIAALLTHQTECIKIISKGKNVHNPKIVSKLFKGRKSTVLLQKCIGIL